MKSYLLGWWVYSFVDGSLPCSPSYVISSFMAAPVTNPTFLSWNNKTI